MFEVRNKHNIELNATMALDVYQGQSSEFINLISYTIHVKQ